MDDDDGYGSYLLNEVIVYGKLSDVVLLADGGIFCAGGTTGKSYNCRCKYLRLPLHAGRFFFDGRHYRNTPGVRRTAAVPRPPLLPHLPCLRCLRSFGVVLGDWDGPNAGSGDRAAFILSSDGQNILWRFQVMRENAAHVMIREI